MVEPNERWGVVRRGKLSYLTRGSPKHPLHPPLTNVTIGAYTVSTILGVLGALGVSEGDMAKAWWLGLIVGLAFSVPTMITGLTDWFRITWGTPLWKHGDASHAARRHPPVRSREQVLPVEGGDESRPGADAKTGRHAP